MSRAKTGFRAFTLIELLIVISIISLLISILMPALAGARTQGSRVSCLSNLRSIARTAIAYANDDEKGIYGPIHRLAGRFINEGYAEYGGGPGDMDYLNWGEEFDPRTRPFNALMIGAQDMFPNTAPGDHGKFRMYQCGGDEFGWQVVPGFDSDDRETERSYYTANGTAFRMNNMKHHLGSFLGVYGRPLSRIPDTGATVGFMEARAFQTAWTNNTWGSLARNVEGGMELTSYHKKIGHFNLAFCDGHVSFADMGNGTWHERIQKLRSRDFRGNWGLMDTLPDKPMRDNDARRPRSPMLPDSG